MESVGACKRVGLKKGPVASKLRFRILFYSEAFSYLTGLKLHARIPRAATS